jgi:hypothetical protein
MTPQRIVPWDPRDPVPEASADPDTATVVTVRSIEDIRLAYRWLASGKHPFRSVGIDSLQEVQETMIAEIAGEEKLLRDHFGEILRQMGALLTNFVDLRNHPHSPVDAVVIVVGSKDGDDGTKALILQGQIRDKALFKFDVVGYMAKGMAASDDGPQKVRYMVIDSYDPKIPGKDNTHVLSHHYGDRIFNPDVSEMLAVLNPNTPTEGPK